MPIARLPQDEAVYVAIQDLRRDAGLLRSVAAGCDTRMQQHVGRPIGADSGRQTRLQQTGKVALVAGLQRRAIAHDGLAESSVRQVRPPLETRVDRAARRPEAHHDNFEHEQRCEAKSPGIIYGDWRLPSSSMTPPSVGDSRNTKTLPVAYACNAWPVNEPEAIGQPDPSVALTS